MSTDAVSPRSRKSFQQELVPSRQDRSQRSNRDFGGDVARSARRRSKHQAEQPTTEAPPSAPPSASPPEASTQPVGTPTPVSQPTEERTLAERYVAQYEEQSGSTLSSEQRSAKISEVEQFYLSRQGRLDKIVFA